MPTAATRAAVGPSMSSPAVRTCGMRVIVAVGPLSTWAAACVMSDYGCDFIVDVAHPCELPLCLTKHH